MVSKKMFSQPLVVVPRSLEPRQVNDFQEPVFTVRVSNAGDVDIEVLPRTRLWVVDYENAPERGFAADLEAPVYVPARREAVMRFQPVHIEIPTINEGIFPLRIQFAILLNGSEQSFTTVSSENSVRVGGNAGIEPVESIGMGIQPGQTVIVGRSGGYLQLPVIMKDMFPVNVKLQWTDPQVDWRVFSDDGVDLVASREVILRQARAWTHAGVWIEPGAMVPANVVRIIGTLIAVRCPVDGRGGLSACKGAGGRVRAVVAESAAIEMGAPTCALPSVSGGEELDIQATLTNPFHYEVDLANHGIPSLQRSGQSAVIDETGMFSCRPRPRRQDGINRDDVGVRAYHEGVEVPDALDFVTMIAPDSLQPQESRSVGWRVRISHSAPRGRYRLQPFTTSTVWLSARFGNWPKLEARIDPGASDPAFGVEIDVT